MHKFSHNFAGKLHVHNLQQPPSNLIICVLKNYLSGKARTILSLSLIPNASEYFWCGTL